ncbi:MAG: hypothetical protein KDA66_00135 [Planctomycetaceae bacterium]|nr:hypothetical protein [Planctomycetaceae bacterium]
MKSLDRKLAAIHADPTGCREFIIADAKDADMAFGIGAPGKSPERHDAEVRQRTLAEYREQIRQVIQQGAVDIVLMSASTSDQLVLRERLFDDSHVTPAVRANDTTDIHVFRGSVIGKAPAKPFRTVSIDQAQCGKVECGDDERGQGVDLGLYSVTFNNNCELDLETLNAYKLFREEAERKGFRHFLEVFNPNMPHAVSPELLPHFINDVIARTLAGVPAAGRPVFLKIPYPGPAALEDLVQYDPHLVVGILGGSSGTTRDAFQLLHDAQKHGARLALFGRKINNSEHQLAFIEFLRRVADGDIQPEEAVRAYHGVLQALQIKPWRPLEEDLQVTDNAMSYGGESTARKRPASSHAAPTPTVPLAQMTSEERLAYHRERLRRELGD